MSSAASKASNLMGGSKRSRPSMSQKSSDDAASAPLSADVSSQYASLSERLARENAEKKPKVRWAETAALASTLDAERAEEERSALDAVSDLFQKKYTVPVFLLVATGIFLMVHLSGRDGNELYTPKAELSHQESPFTASSNSNDPFPSLQKARSFNVGQGDGFTSLIFSFVPTPAPSGVDQTAHPTSEVMLHSTPKMVRAGIPSLVAGKDGFEPGWILVPTTSTGKGNGLEGGEANVKGNWGYPPGVPTPDPALLGLNGPLNTEVAPDKWGFPAGMPTPDPALLGNVSPLTTKWNFPDGAPTPDPIYLPKGPSSGDKVGLLWGYPPGVPTPNPDLLVEVAPDNTSPTTLKWNIPLGQPTPDPALLGQIDDTSPTTLKWKIPLGQPTPDPAVLENVGKPVTLGWGYPPGVPTPDPALLTEVADKVTWGYPPGVPTPDPALLEGHVVSISWGYPPGVPTPDPALLSGETIQPTLRIVEKGRSEKVTVCHKTGSAKNPWVELEINESALQTHLAHGDTEGHCSQNSPGKEKEKVTVCHKTASVKNPWVTIEISSSALQTHLDHGDTEGPCLETVPKDAEVTFKMPDVLQVPPPPPPPEPEQVQVLPEPVPKRTRSPAAPKVSDSLEVEVAPPRPAPKIPITVTAKNPPLPPPPAPLVISQPYSGDVGWFRPLGTNPRPPRPVTAGGPRPPRPAQQQLQQGYVMQQYGCGCGCGCCGCGGGMMGGMGMMGGFSGAVPASDGSNTLMVPQFMAGTASYGTRMSLPGLSLPGLPQPQCPWDCMIDETVPTKGRSNEDDAIYEIFYTNPLHCCGTIIEIGAGNGIDNSPSYFFEYGMNWTAILTEADPINFDLVTKERTGDKAMLLNGAFCQEGPHIYFDDKSRSFQTEASGQYSSEALSQTKFPITDQTPKVECIRLDNDILSGIDHVDVMVVRVKGDPWAVIRTMNWDVTVDIWVILMEDKPGMLHDTLRAALKLHDYVPAAWEIKLWCESPTDCMQNEVWLRKSFSALPKPLMGMDGSPGLRGSSEVLPQ